MSKPETLALILGIGLPAYYVVARYGYLIRDRYTREERYRRKMSRKPGGTVSYEYLYQYWDGAPRAEWRREIRYARNGLELENALELYGRVRNITVIDSEGSRQVPYDYRPMPRFPGD